ncbi:rhomboid-domain-containing protein [Auricularia subglabra TFB-10046 SS5]|nr:rhomboid-domain-containing protein [Auricularia subglabra TFB-10046 SS5]
MLATSTRFLFRPSITRPAFRANLSSRISIPCRRPLSTAQSSDWRLLLWRGRPDAHTSVEATARRLPRRESSFREDSGSSGFSDESKARIVVYAILGVNTVVFGAWYMAKNAYTYQNDWRPLQFMLQNFTASLANLSSGRIWTLLTSCFSHEALWHFGLNSACIYFMAPGVCQVLGPGTFIAFYMTTGIISSLTSVAYKFANHQNGQSLGASGAAYATISFFACLFPHAQLLIFGIIPAPAWACVGAVFAWDLWGVLAAQPNALTDSAGHIGGILSGIAYYLIRRGGYKRLFRR